MTEKELLEEQLKQLENIPLFRLNEWRSETLPVVAEIFKESSSQYKQFSHIGFYSMGQYSKSDLSEFRNCINGMIKSLSIRKTHSRNVSENSPVVINNNPSFSQYQNQTQTFKVEDIIKDEFPPAKLREIKEIADSEESKETKLQKIGEVMQKTGVEVISSTLAKIITNLMGIF